MVKPGYVSIDPSLQKAYRDTLLAPFAPDGLNPNLDIIPVAVIATVNTASLAQFVKITDGTTNAAVNTNGSLNVNIISQSTGAKTFQNQAGASTTVTLGTVPAGKQWRVLNMYASITTTAAGSNVTYILNGVTQFILTGGSITSNANQAIAHAYNACPILATGQTAQITTSVTCSAWASIFVIEEPTGTL